MRDPLHILAASRSLPFHSIGGMQAIAWDVLTEFVRLGHRVTALTTEIPGRNGSFSAEGVMVVPVPGSAAERYSRRWWRGSRECAAQVHRATSVDAVLSVSVAAAGLLPLRRRQLAAPFLFQAHGTAWGEAVSKWHTGRALEVAKSVRNLYWVLKDVTLYRSFDQLVLVGDTLRRQFDAPPLSWMTREVPTSVICNGVDTNRFHPDSAARRSVRERFGWTEHEPVVVFCARLHVQKGAAAAIAASAHLRSRGVAHRLLIIGGGPEERALRQLAGAGEACSAVTFTGSLPRAQIAQLLAAADAFVFPSRRREAGVTLNVLEALATGLPCVCSTSLREVFGATLPIRYADPDDVPVLAEALHAALVCGASPASLLPAHYSLRACAAQYLDVIDALRAA